AAAPRVAVRSGDPAPIQAHFGTDLACRLAAPPGGLVFVDAAGSALFLRESTGVRALAYVGQGAPGGSVFASFCEAAAGADGTIAFHAFLADGREGIYRLAPGSEIAESVIVTGEALDLRGVPVTLALLAGPAVDGQGNVVLAVDTSEGPGAILRLPPGSPAGAGPEVLIQTGDPIGAGRFVRVLTAPAMNAGGTVVFTAALDSGLEVVATLVPGQSPIVLFLGVGAPGTLPPTVAIAPPAINDAGQVAFLWSDAARVVRLQRVSAGLSVTVAAPGATAPDGVTLAEISDLPPALDPLGAVVFGAVRSDGRHGLYVVSGRLDALAEEGHPLGDFGTVTRVPIAQQETAAPVFGADGSARGVVETTEVGGLFALPPVAAGAGGQARPEVQSGEAVPGPARFVSFLEREIPTLGGGPALAPGGSMIFDARLTCGTRGLFVRDRAGRIAPVATDGDLAPGGGLFDGESFSCHSLNGSGTVAFLAATRATAGSPPAGPALYYGRPGTDPLRRVIGVGDQEPGGARTITALDPPSRLNRTGAIAIPVVVSNGQMLLLGYDGASIFRVAAPGDPAPEGARFATLFTGSLFLGRAIPPSLDDAGRVLFGGVTSAGDSALFAALLAPGGGGVPSRVAGACDA
ncbi:MAG TPA: hypothetical protein VFT43_07040, partial [Candidatus Polarisedimenticolia bacterium]|nr:hypothetical protein [Candidatus Polarisedimenticolia bacterium]